MAYTQLSDAPSACNLPGCPAVWADDADIDSALVVGEVVTDSATLAQLNLSPGEGALRVPRSTLSSGVSRFDSES